MIDIPISLGYNLLKDIYKKIKAIGVYEKKTLYITMRYIDLKQPDGRTLKEKLREDLGINKLYWAGIGQDEEAKLKGYDYIVLEDKENKILYTRLEVKNQNILMGKRVDE